MTISSLASLIQLVVAFFNLIYNISNSSVHTSVVQCFYSKTLQLSDLQCTYISQPSFSSNVICLSIRHFSCTRVHPAMRDKFLSRKGPQQKHTPKIPKLPILGNLESELNLCSIVAVIIDLDIYVSHSVNISEVSRMLFKHKMRSVL
uniref:Uncharacterized protein n=1 Tax=Phasianus colchicus TaxID=9054 RepID=A0A669PXJ2_PHACC